MFDKLIIKATIDTADIATIVLRNYLEQCTEGDEIYYKSTAYANFDVALLRSEAISYAVNVLSANYGVRSVPENWIILVQ
ncbi:hypothetical protein BcellWH2_05547 [Bacteroides cellulosilyticus]|uniref:Uncharacterized protein n=1 Tax=Bacteroides cellulosilyticus TaxID=246787 RepID=A0A0P0GN81_9BACE|nr:hypothetical protein BcellWH2_05547 [Bacteroides cellulosilyticus]